MDCNLPGFPVLHHLPVCSNSCPLSQWCHPTISSFVISFSFCLQSFLSSGSFPMSQLFALGSQSTGASASSSVPPMNIHDWFPLGFTDLISLQSTGLSTVFSNTTVQKHQLFGPQHSWWSNSHIYFRECLACWAKWSDRYRLMPRSTLKAKTAPQNTTDLKNYLMFLTLWILPTLVPEPIHVWLKPQKVIMLDSNKNY